MLLSPVGSKPWLWGTGLSCQSVHFYGIQELHPEHKAPLVTENRPFAACHCSSLDLWYFYNF